MGSQLGMDTARKLLWPYVALGCLTFIFQIWWRSGYCGDDCALSFGKGAASLLVALGNRLHARTGSWPLVFALMIAFDWIAALLALFVLRPLRQREKPEARSQKPE